MSRITVTITMSVDDDYAALHMSRPGRAGTGFDTGSNGEEFELAIDDLATELKNIYRRELKEEE